MTIYYYYDYNYDDYYFFFYFYVYDFYHYYYYYCYYYYYRLPWKQFPAFWSAMLVNVDDGDGVRFLARNPKRQRTAWQRYAKYEVATTVCDALKLGAMPKDIKHDV